MQLLPSQVLGLYGAVRFVISCLVCNKDLVTGAGLLITPTPRIENESVSKLVSLISNSDK